MIDLAKIGKIVGGSNRLYPSKRTVAPTVIVTNEQGREERRRAEHKDQVAAHTHVARYCIKPNLLPNYIPTLRQSIPASLPFPLAFSLSLSTSRSPLTSRHGIFDTPAPSQNAKLPYLIIITREFVLSLKALRLSLLPIHTLP